MLIVLISIVGCGDHSVTLNEDGGVSSSEKQDSSVVESSSSSIHGISGTTQSSGASSSIVSSSGTSSPASSSSTIISTTCPSYNADSSFCDSRDGQVYRYTVIGTQKWMGENLNYSGDDGKGNSAYSKGWCYGVADTTKHQDTTTCQNGYGRSYDWITALALPSLCSSTSCTGNIESNQQGLCPDGWHVPTDAEWMTLEIELGMPSDTANKTGIRGHEGILLKSVSTTGANINIVSTAYDEVGFTAIPSGNYIGNTQKWADRGSLTFFWTATENGASNVWYRMLNVSNKGIQRGNESAKKDGFSLRCLGNDPVSTSTKQCSNTYGNNTVTDCRDGKTYKTATIGTQTWLAENLQYKHSGSSCYHDSASYCETYGKLYTAYSAIHSCPNGWRIPDTTEWNTLVNIAGGTENAGSKLKSTNGWKTSASITSSDEYGFTALPSGASSYAIGSEGVWWSSPVSPYDGTPMPYHMTYWNNRVFDYGSGDWFSTKASARCIKE